MPPVSPWSSKAARCILKKYIPIMAAAKTTRIAMVKAWNHESPNRPPRGSAPAGGRRFISRLNHWRATLRGAFPSARARCAASPLSNWASPSRIVAVASCIAANSSVGAAWASRSRPSDSRAVPVSIRSWA